MKKIYYIVLLILIITGSSIAFAQQEVTIDRVQVELRPEFDSSDILIIYSVVLNENLDFPVDVSVKIPASSGGPSVVWEVIDGSPKATTYSTTEEGEWISVNITSESQVIYVDFYDPEFSNQNLTRSYTYNYPPELISDVVELAIWQPAETEDFQASGDLPQKFEDDLGIIYHVGNIHPDELDGYQINFSYKATFVSDNSVSSDISVTEILPWALGILGVAILGLGIYNMSLKSGTKTKTSKKKYTNKNKSTFKNKGKFCHNCGSNIGNNDKFCSECGAKTR